MAYHHSNGGGGGGVGSSLRSGGGEYSGDERESRSGGDERPDSDLHDKPIYLLEHLATFTVNKESGIVYPADGMRRLLQLEKTTGIWSQKMQLCLDYQWVLIMDYETGNIIERFPATLIQEPTAFTSTDAMELYNNILVFIVSGGSGARSEMHIFQSQSVSAVHLVEDLKNLRSGKMVTQQREAMQQQQQHQQMTKSMITTMHSSNNRTAEQIHQHQQQQHQQQQHHQQQQQQNQIHHQQQQQQHHTHQQQQQRSIVLDQYGHGETDSDHGGGGGLNDETSSTSSDKYERDVTVLNHCFDDIEKFIARLQHAAAASRELERRRRNRKTKKKDPGEGLLTLRTRPPHEKEFVDIFAKFKLSFNLLAKLKAHIHDPNAPELVHFLFTPLALIVEASSDTYYESQLPGRVVNPLLTREAINLLINCVTSKETELWRSLGDSWIVARDQWKEDVGSYHPVFLDGWSPDYLVIDELEAATHDTSNATASAATTMAATAISAGTATPTNINKRRLESQLQQHHGGALNGRGAGVVGSNAAAIAAHQNAGGLSGGYDDYDDSAIALSGKYIIHDGERSGNAANTSAAANFSTRSEISIDSIERNGLNSHNLGGGGNSSGGAADVSNTSGVGVGAVQNAAIIQSIAAGMQHLHTRERTGGGGMGAYGGGGMPAQSELGGGVIRGGGGGSVVKSNVGDDQQLEAWLDDLQAAGAKIVLVTYPRTANNDKELSVVRGEYLEILDDTRKWWKARNIRAQIAHVPHTIVTPYNYGDAETPINQFYGQQQQQNNYKSRHSASLNAVVSAEQQLPQQQQQQRSSDTTDWIRNKHLEENVYTEVLLSAATTAMQHVSALALQCGEYAAGSTPGPPPPPRAPSYVLPPPPQLPNSSDFTTSTSTTTNSNIYSSINKLHTNNINNKNDSIRSTSTSNNNNDQIDTMSSGSGAMQDELKHVLRMRERRGDLEIHKTPTIYIAQSSSASNVVSWLQAKEFSNAIVQRLAGFSGEDLLALPKERCEELFGQKEGRRLASQIKLQKSVSGYKTARSSELQAVLARARPKSEICINELK